MSLYEMGAHALGSTGLPRARVRSKDTAAYQLSSMSDEAAKSLGDGDPAMKIEPGVEVDIVGPDAKNAHGVAYTPVQLTGQADDRNVYWIRSASLDRISLAAPKLVATAPTGSRTSGVNAASFAPVPAEGRPWWHYAAAVAGAGAIGLAAYMIVKSTRST